MATRNGSIENLKQSMTTILQTSASGMFPFLKDAIARKTEPANATTNTTAPATANPKASADAPTEATANIKYLRIQPL